MYIVQCSKKLVLGNHSRNYGAIFKFFVFSNNRISDLLEKNLDFYHIHSKSYRQLKICNFTQESNYPHYNIAYIVTLIALKSKFLTTYNFCFIHVIDLISFLVDQKFKSIYENVQTGENRPRITAVVV